MAPAGQGQSWSDVLCCILCNQVFSGQRLPVNLACGHVICRPCLLSLESNICPLDESEGRVNVSNYPSNSALLHIVTGGRIESSATKHYGLDAPTENFLQEINNSLKQLASHLCRAESERGGSVYSEVLSRTMQRKLVSLLCFQLVEEEGRSRALKTCRAVADRVMTEVILSQQVASHLSTQLWTAVRSRGCQFLGPAMQEDVLKLILLTLGTGAPIARKTLVMYVVQVLTDDYPQVSKTCVGHVVQLLYRASCFHVLKREGESSLMQLKEDFRNYDSLRKEHDMQIVQMALEAGLRICPDQWSSLLYGDQLHRSHMQSIIDKLSSLQSYQQGLDEVTAIANKGDDIVAAMLPLLESFCSIHPTHHERVSLERFTEHLNNLSALVELLVQHNTRRQERRARESKDNFWRGRSGSNVTSNQSYKTKMCRDIMSGLPCPRGNRCTWAHSQDEMQEARTRPTAVVPAQVPIQPNNNIQQIPRQPPYAMPMTHIPPRPAAIPVPVQMQMIPPPQFTPASRRVPQPNGILPQEGVPMVPVAAIHPQPMPLQPMLIMPSAQPANQVIMAPPPRPVPPPPMWQPQPVIIQQQASHPSPTHQTFWISQNPPIPVYPLQNNNFDVWSRNDSQKLDTNPDQLFLKRKELISRLAPFTMADGDDDVENDGGIGHVSYTVASSVLDERNADFQFSFRANNPPLELPPIPVSYAPVLPNVPPEESIMIMGDIAAIQARPRAPSLPMIQVTTVLTACPGGLLTTESAKPATVQADCSEMQITDSVSQPLPTAVIQGTQVSVVSLEPGQVIMGVPQMVPVVGSLDPQDVVSNTIDRIVDVKERLNEATAAPISSAVSEQLREELRIAEREMDSLDPRTQASCLLRELEQVDREIERMELSRPPVDC